MKAYTLSILTKLAGQDTGHPIVEREIVAWANEKVRKLHNVRYISLWLYYSFCTGWCCEWCCTGQYRLYCTCNVCTLHHAPWARFPSKRNRLRCVHCILQPIGCSVEAVATMIGCLPTQAVAFSLVSIQTQPMQAIAFGWKPGFIPIKSVLTNAVHRYGQVLWVTLHWSSKTVLTPCWKVAHL